MGGLGWANPFAMSQTPILVKWKRVHVRAQVPQAASGGAACFDFCAALDQPMVVKPGEIVLIPTGLAVELPLGYELQVRARSGLAAKFGLMLVNGIGTIDSDYRGEIKVIAALVGKHELTIQPGDRIAQGLVAPVLQIQHCEVKDLGATERGEGGFGSTGVAAVDGKGVSA